MGADGVELDLHASWDGELIVHHDPKLAGAGLIAEADWPTIDRCRLPNGDPVPRLMDALNLLRGLDVWIEIKALPPQWDTRLLQTLAGGPEPTRYAVHSFDHRVIRRLGAREPGLRRGVLSTSYVVDPVAMLEAAGAVTLWQEFRLVDLELVEGLHRRRYAVMAWTLNDESDIERLARMGVDGICGNYPDRIRRVVQRIAA